MRLIERDDWINWTPQQREQRLGLIAHHPDGKGAAPCAHTHRRGKNQPAGIRQSSEGKLRELCSMKISLPYNMICKSQLK